MTVPHRSSECASKVSYEIKMFRHTYLLLEYHGADLASAIPGAVHPVQQAGTAYPYERGEYGLSAILESYLLHARVLYEFFCLKRSNDPHHADDLKASDFASGWEFDRKRAAYLKDEHTRLHKSLAHLTTTRVQSELDGERWNLATINQEIERLIERFESETDPTVKEGGWFSGVFSSEVTQASPKRMTNNAAISSLPVDVTRLPQSPWDR